MGVANGRFWERHPGLVWSNPAAEDSVWIRAALLRPRFSQLLDIAHYFGIERVEAEWSLLTEEGTPEARRAEPIVTRVLSNIRSGIRLASGGH